MEYKILEKITEQIKQNSPVALATLTNIEGSTPGKKGAMMAVLEDGTTYGTVGGGRVELVIAGVAKKCIEERESKSYSFKLDDDPGSLHMQCGGEAEVFIKVFKPDNKLLIAGGGHIGINLYKLGKILGFHTVIFDEREEYCNKDRFPEADELYPGDIEENLKNYPIGQNCYIAIVTHGHKHDEIALKTVIERDASYIGMIGSSNKTKHVMGNLAAAGVSQDKLDSVYAPVGINLGGQSPEDIALGIMAEISLIKNKGTLHHTKEIKK
ncbi:XdhC family protein [Brassicibacter mesophilus]|uniref:XdhC family protein n=1 Tax=Brassicibacter mesophilus TaxID=745119 RepID=UPI003D244575